MPASEAQMATSASASRRFQVPLRVSSALVRPYEPTAKNRSAAPGQRERARATESAWACRSTFRGSTYKRASSAILLLAVAGVRRQALYVAALLAVLAASPAATAARGAYVEDSLATSYLAYSAWAHRNDVRVDSCTGIGRARKTAVATQHSAFRCRVRDVTSGQVGVVIATALGPQWLRVTRIVSGKLKLDTGIGPLPKGQPRLDSDDANQALERSAWARANRIIQVFCVGVGPYVEHEVGDRFYTFSCATIDRFGRREGTVLIVATGSNSVRVVRRLS